MHDLTEAYDTQCKHRGFFTQGHGLDGIQYDDVEEVWVEDEDGNGEWQLAAIAHPNAIKGISKKLPLVTNKRLSTKIKRPDMLLNAQEMIEEI